MPIICRLHVKFELQFELGTPRQALGLIYDRTEMPAMNFEQRSSFVSKEYRMKRIVLNDTDIKLLKLVGATAGVKIYVGAVKHSIVFFTHFGAVFRNEEVEDRDSMVFVYHTKNRR